MKVRFRLTATQPNRTLHDEGSSEPITKRVLKGNADITAESGNPGDLPLSQLMLALLQEMNAKHELDAFDAIVFTAMKGA